ncbi:c-type cytochrome [Solilutibacter silvestris]|uniref:Cytochrome C oxidase, cbb3-type, subunit III n=1 Tax=Solilutibacter silvestris TaxID=1645665 RepID=A0A2K1Q1A4_9GAMM|nr:c-type cytochrome [Lysobacter silvestris]PNS08823.1 Cytochrome C oxidase, cbb3-type, subunit III [Lysobacter silvestris]
MNRSDLDFLKKFSVVIAILLSTTIVLIFLGSHLAEKYHKYEVTPQAAAQTEARIAPVGAVFAGEAGKIEHAAAEDAAKKRAASEVAYGGTTDGKIIFGNLCTGCHTSGAGGAPTLDAAHWAARAAEGKDTLYQHAINGFTGNSGVMPAKGGNPALTDAQVKATVDWMVAQATGK